MLSEDLLSEDLLVDELFLNYQHIADKGVGKTCASLQFNALVRGQSSKSSTQQLVLHHSLDRHDNTHY